MRTASRAAAVVARRSQVPSRPGSSGPRRIKRLLLPTDFSDLARGAFPFARELARRYKAAITLLHVVPAQLPADLSHLGIVFAEKRAVAKSVNYLNTLREGEFDRNLTVKTAVVQGDPAPEIVQFAKEIHADLIMLATHGYSGLKKLVLGSTAEKVLRSAPCPVLLVPARLF